MLTREQLRGIWVGIPTEWDAEGRFDERVFRDEVAMLIDAGVHGIYTTGTTGEFYALNWEEYTQLVDAFAGETVGKCPMQVGANWFNTRDTIERVRYARDRGIDGVQIIFPPWIEMRLEDYDQFLVDVYEAVPDISLIHYNCGRAKKVFKGPDYARVLPRVPTLIGSKAIVPLDDFMGLKTFSPGMHHFIDTHLLALGMQIGAQGAYDTISLLNPRLVLDYWALCEAGRWDEALDISLRLWRWFNDAVIPLAGKGYRDPTLDKAFAELGGWLPGNRRTRKPHYPVTDEDFAWLKARTQDVFPELMAYRI